MLKSEESEFNRIKREYETMKEYLLSINSNGFYITWDDQEAISEFINNLVSDKIVREFIQGKDSGEETVTLTEGSNITFGNVSNRIQSIFNRIYTTMRTTFNRILGRQELLSEADESKYDLFSDFEEPEDEEENLYDEWENQKNKEYRELFGVAPEDEDFRDIALGKLKEKFDELQVMQDTLDQIYFADMNREPSGRVINKQHDGPGILDDYRQGSWGIERICLDGIQNHLPQDAKGTKTYLQFKIGDKWVSRDEAAKNPDRIKEVRFCDNGVGFTSDNLFYLHSTKTSEDLSAGQFGEGMKLASIAAVNLGLGLEFQSRNWRAFASSEEKKLTNTRKNDEVEIRRKLVYDVKEYDGEPIVGSRTIFHTPTREFIDFCLELPEKVMVLSGKKEIFSNENGSIIDMTPEEGKSAYFVKGIYLRDVQSFFTYNFNTADINPDRNGFGNFNPEDAVEKLLGGISDPEIAKELMKRLIQFGFDERKQEKKDGEEDNLYKRTRWSRKLEDAPIEVSLGNGVIEKVRWASNETKKFWADAFYDACLELGITSPEDPYKVAMTTDYVPNEQAQAILEGYPKVYLSNSWTNALISAGVKTDKDVVPEFKDEIITTSLTLDYGSQIWQAERVALDACQNHLPSDSGGSKMFLRFKDKYGSWYDYRKFSEFSDDDITAIKISDDGIGYDYKNLGLFASVKSAESSGKWGEGLKMLCAAALRSGTKMELRSRDWLAVPGITTVTLNEGKKNEKKVDRLIFTVSTKINPNTNKLTDGDNPYSSDYGYTKSQEKSSTIFLEPSKELIQEFRQIQNKVLYLSPRLPIAKSGETELLATTGSQVFVRNILIPGEHPIKFSYHFKDFDVETRDRDAIKSKSLKGKVREFLEKCDDERFMDEFLSAAVAYTNEKNRKEFAEFTTDFDIPAYSEAAEKWVKVFKQKFGDRTAVRRERDLDFNAVHRAQHMGIDMISMPDTVARALNNIVTRSGEKIATYEAALNEAIENAVFIPEEELTEEEKAIRDHLFKYNSILNLSGRGTNLITKINIYDYPEGYDGEMAAGFAATGNLHEINLSRDTIHSGLIYAGDTFFHEADHAISGAEDADAIFRDYLSNLLGAVAAQMYPFQKSLDNNSFAGGISIDDVSKVMQMLGMSLLREGGIENDSKIGDDHDGK